MTRPSIKSRRLWLAICGGLLLLLWLALGFHHDSSRDYSPIVGQHVAKADQDYTLRNGKLAIEIQTMPSDFLKEFGPRFDQTAVLRSARVDGENVLGKWGMPDEFGIDGIGVLGYEQAQPGEHFIKIGVGLLERTEPNAYQFFGRYPIHHAFETQVEKSDNRLKVVQETSGKTAWAYRYEKAYQLIEGEGLKISYQLTNRSNQSIQFNHYNHHWFRSEHAPIQAGDWVEVGFPIPQHSSSFETHGRKLRLGAPPSEQAPHYLAIDSAATDLTENHFTLYLNNRAVVFYQADFSPIRFAAYAVPDGFCPEYFFQRTLAAGETATWSASYDFTPAQPTE